MNNFHKTKITEYIKDVWRRIEWKKLKEDIKDVREFDFTITEDCVKVQQDWYCPQVTLKFKYKKGEKD